MRKTIINQAVEKLSSSELDFLDLDHLAQVEFTSECLEHPVESALLQMDNSGLGWQATGGGEQIIRVIFHRPRTIEHIFLIFEELQQSRTQEFVLLWLAEGEDAYREILRQQYHFSPPNTSCEIEHYEVRLNHLKALELRIIPDISGGEACAKLKRLRLA
ncbi:MAG: hypothetical protein ISR72_10895 [Methylobacter sp.]|nr:hypothetical protein [Methylobacter sp.]